jgi:hypothetical protein
MMKRSDNIPNGIQDSEHEKVDDPLITSDNTIELLEDAISRFSAVYIYFKFTFLRTSTRCAKIEINYRASSS